MQEFSGRVAVITGAASPLGSALARRLGQEGMRLVLADSDGAALLGVHASLTRGGLEAAAVHTDVSRPEQVDDLARTTLDRFGGVHLLCNAAGVLTGGLSWQEPEGDWEWLFRVNVLGVAHSVRAFLPTLVKQREPGHVLNVASIAGICPLPYLGVYSATQHAVVALSESLAMELAITASHVGVSVLCGGLTRAALDVAERQRPGELTRSPDAGVPPAQRLVAEALRAQAAESLPPEVIAALAVDAIRQRQFLILPHPEHQRVLRQQHEQRLSGRAPSYEPPGRTAPR